MTFGQRITSLLPWRGLWGWTFVDKTVMLICSVAMFLMLISSAINNNTGLETLEHIQTFDTDERFAVLEVVKIVQTRSLDPQGQYSYPFFYPTLTYFMLRPLEVCGVDISKVNVIGSANRLVTQLSWLAVIGMLYRLMAVYQVERALATIFCLILAAVPEYYRYSQVMHPELLQSALMVLAFYVAVTKISLGGGLLAGLIAGAAFGTKYAGLIALPAVSIPYAIYLLKVGNWSWLSLGRVLLFFNVMTLAFLGGWLGTNPYVLLNGKQFFDQMGYLQSYVGGDPNAQSAWLWYRVIQNQLVAYSWHIVTMGAGLFLLNGLYDWWLAHKDLSVLGGLKQYVTSYHGILWLALMTYLVTDQLFMLTNLHNKQTRYILHFFPFAILVAAVGVNWLYCRLPMVLRSVLLGVLLVAAMNLAWFAVRSTSGFSKRYDHPLYQAGLWMLANVPSSSRIIADKYSYIPAQFQEQYVDWLHWLDPQKLRRSFSEINPDYLVINANCSSRWAWKKAGTTFSQRQIQKTVENNPVCDRYYLFFNEIFAPDSMWRVVYETDTVVILKRANRTSAETSPSD